MFIFSAKKNKKTRKKEQSLAEILMERRFRLYRPQRELEVSENDANFK